MAFENENCNDCGETAGLLKECDHCGCVLCQGCIDTCSFCENTDDADAEGE